MTTLLVYALLTSSLYYLGSRALITRAVWSRYPRKIAAFMDCAACSGFWYGLAVSLVIDPPWRDWYGHLIVALCSITWTPVVAGLMQHSLQALGTAVEDDDDGIEAQ
jgi:hypothetical protein